MQPSTRIYAHTAPPPHKTEEWEPYDEHAVDVATRAAAFTGAFGAAEWGTLAGLWHDLGKLQPDFQRYLRGEIHPGPPHAWVGAMLAADRDLRGLLPLVAAIAAHHGQLLNMSPDAADGIEPGGTLRDRMADWRDAFARLRAVLPKDVYTAPLPPLPSHIRNSAPTDLRGVELFTRMLYSALVDADRLATAGFYARFDPHPTHADLEHDTINDLAARLNTHLGAMPARGSPAVIELRRHVLAACRARASDRPGRFSLTVPTGGGKTLSAMSFALDHALQHGLRRVIVVIPYTSIIEQTASVYANVFGKQNVLEHHSNLDEQRAREDDARGEDLRKLAAENWDAPVIVTTTVQFFESLMGAHASRCRKLHNITRSVVILDEVQTLQPQFLRTVLGLLTQLTDSYGCSVVLSTATPPALRQRDNVTRPGLREVREIVPDPTAMAAAARRVTIEWRIENVTPYALLAEELQSHPQALVIVHRRQDARELAELVGGDALHLSALMCAAHRASVVAEVKSRLDSGRRCVLVSTQLIEAGVDVDFPVVYRALAGLDSIAQSAGRCDREGKLTDAAGHPAGRMIVFRAETAPPPGVPTKAFQTMDVLLKLGPIDPFNPADSERFFDELYRKLDDDQHKVEYFRSKLAFAKVEELFKLIDGDSRPIVVPWGEGTRRIAAYRKDPNRETRRALQPFTVSARSWTLAALREAGVCMPIDEMGFFDVICEGREASYDRTFGLTDRADPILAAESSVV